jgi:hypothetical protein
MIRSRQLYGLAAFFAVAAVACLLVGFLRRHSLEDALAPFGEGAYFNRSGSGAPPAENMFNPFRIGNAYLWLGAGCAFVVTSLVLSAVARLSPRR